MEKNLVLYEGFFFENLGGMMKNVVVYQHITTQTLPTIVHSIMYGRKAKFKVNSYVNDGQCEALKLTMIEGDDQMRALYNIAMPYILLSFTKELEDIDLNNLSFESIENGPILEGTFGGFCNTTNRPLFYPFRYDPTN